MNLLIQLPDLEGPTSLFHGTHSVSDVDQPDVPTIGHAKVHGLSIIGPEHYEIHMRVTLDLSDDEDRVYVSYRDRLAQP